MPPAISPVADLRADLDRLAEALERPSFDLPTRGRDQRRRQAARGSELVRRYLLARLAAPSDPLMVAVFGPTGAGKSTLVSSLAGRTVSEPGTLRPTTRRPVAWCRPRDGERVAARFAAVGLEVVVETDEHPLLDHVVLVDTPDLDSYVAEHAEMAADVLTMSDAAVYVTTPQRYADAVPWQVVAEITTRRMPVVVVANRLSRRSAGAVADLADLLRRHGIPSARTGDILQIQEQRLRAGGRLPRSAVERLSEKLAATAVRPDLVIESTVAGTIDVAAGMARETAAAIRAQKAEGDAMWESARIGYEHQIAEIEGHLEGGDLVRAEVVARWQRMVGVTDLAALIGRGWARLRDLVGGSGPVSQERMAQVGAEARRELVDLALVRAQRATTAACIAWEVEPGLRVVLTDDLRVVGPDLADNVEAEVDGWLAAIVELIGRQGKSRFRVARMASIGINAAATLVLLGVFASTGGITGTEVGVAAGAAAAQQTVLEHLFGSAAAGALGKRLRADLVERLGRVLQTDALRFRRTVDRSVDDGGLADLLEGLATQASMRFDEVRRG